MGSKLHEVGNQLWVPVIPEGGEEPNRYAAALERIVGILDELAEPWQSDAIVLEEVSRPYKERVMNNVHRSEYVEAIVALALKASGWTRMTPWDSWDLEHESRSQARGQAVRGSPGLEEPRATEPRSIRYRSPDGVLGRQGRRCWVPKPGRHADLYVFAWHGADGDTADQRDAGSWEFYVVAERGPPRAEVDRAEGPSGSNVTVRHRRSRAGCGRPSRRCDLGQQPRLTAHHWSGILGSRTTARDDLP